MAGFDAKLQMDGDVAILKVSGQIDAHVAPQFNKHLTEVVGKSKKVVLEVSGLEYVATAGLGVMMASFNDVKSAGGDLILAGMSDKIRKVFDTMGFSKVLKIVSSVDEAKKSF